MKKTFTRQNSLKIVLGAFLLVFAFLFVGCAKTVGEDIFRFEVRELDLVVGETQDLKLVLGTIKEGTIRVEVSETEEPVITVNTPEIKVGEKVSITAVKEGQVNLTVYVVSEESNVKDVITVRVSKEKITALTAVPTKDELYVDETTQFTVTLYPNSDNISKEVTYSSSNPEVGTINEDGLFTAVYPGVTTISVTSVYDNTMVAVKEMKVLYNATEEIKVEEENVSLLWKESYQIVATVLPNVLPNLANPSVTYTSSDEKVASVDEAGFVTAVGVGEATVTIKSVDGVEKVVNFTVNYAATEELTVGEETVELKWKDKHQIVSTITPSNANQTLTYTSSDNAVVTVTNKGNVEAKGAGEATVTVSTADGVEKVVTFKVTYAELTGFTVKAVKEVLTEDKPYKLELNKSITLTITLEPTNAEPLTPVVVSNDSNIVSVDNKTIKGLAVGTTTITVTVGEITQTFTINVVEAE